MSDEPICVSCAVRQIYTEGCWVFRNFTARTLVLILVCVPVCERFRDRTTETEISREGGVREHIWHKTSTFQFPTII